MAPFYGLVRVMMATLLLAVPHASTPSQNSTGRGVTWPRSGPVPNDLPQPYRTTRDWGELPPGMCPCSNPHATLSTTAYIACQWPTS